MSSASQCHLLCPFHFFPPKMLAALTSDPRPLELARILHQWNRVLDTSCVGFYLHLSVGAISAAVCNRQSSCLLL